MHRLLQANAAAILLGYAHGSFKWVVDFAVESLSRDQCADIRAELHLYKRDNAEAVALEE